MPGSTRSLVSWSAALLLAVGEPGSTADETQQTAAAELQVAATVNDREILVSQVQRRIEAILRPAQMTPEALRVLQARTLQQLVRQHLALETIQNLQLAATDQEVDVALAELEDRLQQRGQTLENYLAVARLGRAHLRDELRWKISWQRFVDKFSDQEHLERFFQQHRRQFDGTRMEVAHILLKVPAEADPQQLEAIQSQAVRIRAQITKDELSFAAAAQQYSQSETAAEGGRLGWIERHQPMPEVFSTAAFQLEAGQISQPVASPFGIHLIQCQKIEPGQKTLDDTIDQVREAMARYLFDWAADRRLQDERSPAVVRYTGALPHQE